MAFFKKVQVKQYITKYEAKGKFQGRKPTFTDVSLEKPPKTIRGDHGLVYQRGKMQTKMVTRRKIGKHVF